MTSRHLSESDSFDSLIRTARELVQQLEKVKSAGTHHERAPGRSRLKTTQKQSIDKTHFLTVFRAFSEKAQAYIATLEEQESSSEEICHQETHEQEPHKEPNKKSHEEPHEESHTRAGETRAGRFLKSWTIVGT
ncbi:hypothetical protein J1614_003885 [Plenodomus biglobosus]|nr:hypothetical protein J1614_003885 [Plenodomus biglobosus]